MIRKLPASDANGEEQTILDDDHEEISRFDDVLTTGWHYVKKDISQLDDVTISGEVNIIFASATVCDPVRYGSALHGVSCLFYTVHFKRTPVKVTRTVSAIDRTEWSLCRKDLLKIPAHSAIILIKETAKGAFLCLIHTT